MKILLLIDLQCGFEASFELVDYLEQLDYAQYDRVVATKFVNNENTLFYKNGYKDMMEENQLNYCLLLRTKLQIS